jgi:endoglucanase
MNELSNPTITLLKQLSQAVGITGYTRENGIHQLIANELTPLTDRVEQDRIGSVIGLKNGQQTGTPRRKVMLAAHLDEIGMIVTKIDKGFLRFNQVGGLDDRVLMGQEVTIHAEQDLPGVIGSIPPHLLPGHVDKVNRRDMVIDVGLLPNEVEKLIRVGDLVSFARPPVELLNGLLSTKSMDNRSSVAAMIICLQHLAKIQHQWDVYAVATADEEWGSHTGATTQSYAIQPDVALAIDVTFADVSDVEIKLNAGPVVSLGPSNHTVVRKQLLKICNELEMKYQTEILSSGRGTDAYAIEVNREGIPTVLLSIPSRYMHTPIETVAPKDVERVGRLMAYFIASLDESFVGTLIPEVNV